MFNKQYATFSAFTRLLRSINRFEEKTLRRNDFHKAIVVNGVGLTAPEIDYLFDLLAGQVGSNISLTFDNWSQKIYDDTTNPL